MILSNTSFSPQNYLELVTGECYILGAEDSYRQMIRIMKANGLEDCWDYPLDEIGHVLEHNSDVVLVEMYSDAGGELRWFEVPEHVTKEYVKNFMEGQ